MNLLDRTSYFKLGIEKFKLETEKKNDKSFGIESYQLIILAGSAVLIVKLIGKIT